MKNNIAIKYGLIAGVGVVAYYLLFYYTNIKLFFNPVIAWSSLIIYVGGMVKACADDRQLMAGEDYPFMNGLRMAFATFAITSFIYYAFNYLLYNVLDTELIEVQKEIMFEQIAAMAKRFELSDMKDSIKDFKEQDYSVTIANSLLGWGWSLLGGFIISIIVARIMRR